MPQWLQRQAIPLSNRGRDMRHHGFTLLELMIGSAVLLVAILGLLSFYRSPFVLNEMARDTTVAVQDISKVMEQVRVTPFGSIQTTNWDTWAQNNNAKNLPSETFAVSYAGTDPLEFTVTVQWTRRGRTRDVRLSSRVTQAVLQ